MGTQAKGDFELQWDEEPPYDEGEGGKLARVTVTKKFHGELDAESVARLITTTSGVEGSMGYIAVERVIGTLHGRKGTFVMQHAAIMNRGDGTLSVVIVPDTGTGELKGISGTMSVEITPEAHRYTIDYELAGTE